tara:strand:- start:160 stop:510 length:351 start_codon:yes stop_codon:yes gene_type:complete
MNGFGEDDFARYHMQQKAKQQSKGGSMRSFNWHVDAGHEWLEVELNYLMMKGLANKVSSYSFFSKEKNRAYLEGDMDAGILYRFMGDDWKNEGSQTIDYGMPNNNPIRNMNRFPIR